MQLKSMGRKTLFELYYLYMIQLRKRIKKNQK
nr:MAG TPA: hypothetical protein [Crassvirales sp.]